MPDPTTVPAPPPRMLVPTGPLTEDDVEVIPEATYIGWGRVIRQSLPLPALAEMHAAPAAAPVHEAIRILVERAWADHCDPVLVMAASTRDALAASVRDALGYPATTDITSAYGVRIELDDAVHPGTVLAYRWEEFEIIRGIREDHPDLSIYPAPPAERETRRG